MAVDAYSLLLRIFTFLEKKALLWTNEFKTSFTHCKYSIVRKKKKPFHSFELLVLTEFCLDTISVDEIKTYHYVWYINFSCLWN